MVTLEQFLKYAVKSGLVTENQLREIVDAAKAELALGVDDVTRLGRLAQLAVVREMLTSWQCAKLLEGRYKGFFLGSYKLLAFLGSSGAASRYLAENSEGGEVEILVAPADKRTRFIVMKPGSFIEDDAIDS
jgi:eukaryotic-like serine/threonine-protein kinase